MSDFHLQRLDIRNVLRIKVFTTDIEKGELVELNGDNGQGKTSVIDGLMMLLAGTKEIPPQPTRLGSEDSSVEAWIKSKDEVFNLRRRFSKKGTSSIEVKDGAGLPISSPQTFLDGLITRFGIDPLKFHNMKPKEQCEEILKIVDLPIDLEQHEIKRTEIFDKRTEVGRELKQAEGALFEIPTPESDTPDKEVNFDEINKEYQAAQKAHREYDYTKTKTELLEKELETNINELELLQERIKAQQNELSLNKESLDKHKILPDVEEIADRIRNIQETNRQVREKVKYNEVRERVEEIKKSQGYLTEQIQTLDDEKGDALLNSKFLIEELGIGADGLTYRGFPLEQAGGTERWHIAIAIAIAAQEKLAEQSGNNLKILFIDDVGNIDKANLLILRDTLKKEGYQGILTAVRSTGIGDCVIEIADGKIKENPEP